MLRKHYSRFYPTSRPDQLRMIQCIILRVVSNKLNCICIYICICTYIMYVSTYICKYKQCLYICRCKRFWCCTLLQNNIVAEKSLSISEQPKVQFLLPLACFEILKTAINVSCKWTTLEKIMDCGCL